MTSVFLAFDYAERASWSNVNRVGSSAQDLQAPIATTPIVAVKAEHALFALPASAPLNALFRSGVTVELFEGCAAARVSGLSDAEHSDIVRSLSLESAAGSTEEIWFMSLLKNAAQSAGSDAASGHLRLLAASLRSRIVVDADELLDHVECEFVALQVDRRAGDRMAQTALRVVRDTLLTNKALVWYCGDGSVFTFTDGTGPRLADATLRGKYAACLRSLPLFDEAPNGSFVRRDGARTGLMVFSDQRGIAARGRAVIEQFLQRRAVVDEADLPALRSRADVVELKRAMHEAVRSDVVLVGAAGITPFTDAHEERLIALLRGDCPKLCAVGLTRTLISVDALRRVLAAASKRVRLLLVDESLFLQLSADEMRDARVVPASFKSVVFADAAERARFAERVEAALSFWMQKYTFPDTPQEADAFRKMCSDNAAQLAGRFAHREPAELT